MECGRTVESTVHLCLLRTLDRADRRLRLWFAKCVVQAYFEAPVMTAPNKNNYHWFFCLLPYQLFSSHLDRIEFGESIRDAKARIFHLKK